MVLSFLIFKPFLYAILLAVFVVTIFNPLHLKILTLTRGNKGLAALLSVLSVVLVIIIPITFLATQILREATHVYQYLLSSEGTSTFSNSVNLVLGKLGKIIPVSSESSLDIHNYFKQGFDWLLPLLSSFVSNLARLVVNILMFLIASYYLFKDGDKFKKAIIDLSPLRNIHDKEILTKLGLAINTVVKGNLIIALIQGSLTAIGLYLFGVPGPILWGAVASVAAVIPGFGTSLVIGPAVIFLLFRGDTFHASGLFIWGLTAVGLIDNFLGPKIVERGVKIHPFLILLSILGGLALFGPLGFLFGPLVLSLLFAVTEIYYSIYAEHQGNS